ncbi:MAG: hypothetical protein OJF49_002343 [Ktedonobacterales bacterium]|jgi:sarcosine oxidase subunit beta|nr:MAG: hypothetical protein OJF49_002343 [Ktedonobacterales bacterium]
MKAGAMANDDRSEVLVLGGGIAGTSTAYYLARYGHDVTLLERGEIAGAASGLNAGTIWAVGWGTLPTLDSTLSMGSLEMFQTFQFELDYDLGFRQGGSLQVIQTEAEYQFASESVRRLTTQGFHVELCDARDARTIEPALSDHVLGCVSYPLGASADPAAITRAFAAEAQRHGARILPGHDVTALACGDDGAGYTVTTTEGRVFSARTLVLAAGAWSRQVGALLGLELPVFAVRGQMWATAPTARRLFHSIGAVESARYWHADPAGSATTPLELTHWEGARRTRHLYGQQLRDGTIIIGGDRQLSDDATPDPEGIAANHAHARELFPFLRDLPIQRTWAGWMPFTARLEPIIGKISGFERLYVLTGLSSSGFEQGPMAGKLLADYIHTGEAAPLLAAADPMRQVSALAHPQAGFSG